MADLHVKMKVNSVAKLTRGEELRARLLELALTGVPDDQIAEILTREGHHSPNCEDKVLPITVQRASRQRRSATDGHTNLLCSAPYNWPPGSIFLSIGFTSKSGGGACSSTSSQPEHICSKIPQRSSTRFGIFVTAPLIT
ncbi:hypothetical protein [Rhizobium johnstonii]|uniref:hypothetical protein n=1 Tax=Rhizobium johnstonii TaxID=3019933 RepID=UPI003F9D6EB2